MSENLTFFPIIYKFEKKVKKNLVDLIAIKDLFFYLFHNDGGGCGKIKDTNQF